MTMILIIKPCLIVALSGQLGSITYFSCNYILFDVIVIYPSITYGACMVIIVYFRALYTPELKTGLPAYKGYLRYSETLKEPLSSLN